jgi:hypothetical protein
VSAVLGRLEWIMDSARLLDCHRCSPCSCRERWLPASKPINPAQDLGEQGARHRHLRQLEHDLATMARDPGAYLDQLLA